MNEWIRAIEVSSAQWEYTASDWRHAAGAAPLTLLGGVTRVHKCLPVVRFKQGFDFSYGAMSPGQAGW